MRRAGSLLTPVTLALVVTYPPAYPDEIPGLALEEIAPGELRDGEADAVVTQLSAVVRRNTRPADSRRTSPSAWP